MPEKDELTKDSSISRRQFIKNTGIVVGGTAIGSSALLAACKGDTTTETATNTVKVTTTVAKFVCPYDSIEFDTFAALQSHVDSAHEAGDPVTKYLCPYDNQEFSSLADLKAHLEAQHLEAIAPIEGMVTLKVNGKDYPIVVDPNWSLGFVLREKLGLTGTKIGCDRGECGSCTVHMDGTPVYACMVLACEAEGHEVLTIEGLANGAEMHPVQKLFLERSTFQCGYCTPGNIMTTVALYKKTPKPTRAQAREALSGNLCFCIDYTRIIDTIVAGGS
ncbi:MAG: (2Fe-2S)-binding protein [Dehalococcoidales bacterium]|jgi:xanthine dehydrogenase YagT iron-sulfur-binding subunit|nr:(2Fe-2S)-binding protein [Dehalococcoidales bacterium]MDX9986739.1 (2Fe-2S)-binding protein [Dehalococcoidales bacterium]